MTSLARPDQPLLDSLDAPTWTRANHELLAKIVTELTFEDVLTPEQLDTPKEGENDQATTADVPTPPPTDALFRLTIDDRHRLTYVARLRSLGHWRVDPTSLRWFVDGTEQPLPDVADAAALILPAAGVDPSTTAGALCELTNTVVSDVWQLTHGRPAAALVDMLDQDPNRIEGEMRAHPWIVTNKGRLGFDAHDLATLTPEAQHPLRLLWLAAVPGRADARAVPGLDHATVVREQVGDDTWSDLRVATAAAGLDPDQATYVPVHPWQWRHRIATLHAADLARGELTLLGEAPARYLPQQSIRTLFDVDHPERRYLKLPLSILNTSVYRGLPRRRTLAAPALSEWFAGLVEGDPFLKEIGLVLLGEVAGVSVRHPGFEAIAGVPYQHTEMLGAIWRESVAGKLAAGERAVTLAALLHRDPAGVPFLEPLVGRSGLAVADWVDRLHDATLPPLAHVLYRYGTSFSPHGQNCLLALRDGVPARLVVKDFIDDVVVSPDPLPELASLPADVQATLAEDVEPILAKYIHGALLVCVHRYLAELLDDHFGYPEAAFWASARRALRTYQERFADDLAERYALFELDAPRFKKLCLNRLRLYDRGYADDPERPIVTSSGWIENPLAG